jgi:uncharacterized protein (TIGR03790 family)
MLMRTVWRTLAILGLLLGIARCWSGGSGLNVVVVVNQASSNSVTLGNYYCERRAVPPQNVLRINWTGSLTDWTRTNLDAVLRAPLNAMLASRKLTNQVDFLLLSMDIPYRVTENTGATITSGVNSTTSALYYGFKPDGCSGCATPSCNLPAGSASAYAGSEAIFRQPPPVSASSNAWLVMMLTSSNLAAAKAVVDRGVASDYSFPTQAIYLAKSQDRLRIIRHWLFDDAIINSRLVATAVVMRTNVPNPTALGVIQGYLNGEMVTPLLATNFAPGALAETLTSYSGNILENSGHTDALDYLNAGATASYGTVVEPCAYFEKFASPQNYFYQARGFSAAECFFLSLTNPYQGLLVGEPLAAPFATPMTGGWSNLPAGAPLAGVTNLSLGFQSTATGRPVQRVDLFVDGLLVQTLTNLPPQTNNILHVTLNGFPTNYVVPAAASLASIASNLTARLNTASYTNATKVRAFAHGDRIELRSTDINRPGANTLLAVSNAIGTGAAHTAFVVTARTNFLDRVADGVRNYVVTNASGSNVPVGAFLLAVVVKTNGAAVSVGMTNTTGTNTLASFARQWFVAISNSPAFQSSDGLLVDDVNMHEDTGYAEFIYGFNDHSGSFNLRARSPGWPESQMAVRLLGSSGLSISPGNTNRLDMNAGDLQPRNHLYLAAGVTNLNLAFPFNSTLYADGAHELTAVAYEGTHVRTQKRVSQSVWIRNLSPFSAQLSTLVGDTNTALEATLQFQAEAVGGVITNLELFSTGGLLSAAGFQSAAAFSVAATNLGVGLHPFYLVATRNDGKKCQTATQWIRIVGAEPPFKVNVTVAAPQLSWPASAGRQYSVLSATNVINSFTVRGVVTPTNSAGRWSETNATSPQRFYRVKTP